MHSLKPTFLHREMDGWNTSFLLGWPIFGGYVSFRECRLLHVFFSSAVFLFGVFFLCYSAIVVIDI